MQLLFSPHFLSPFESSKQLQIYKGFASHKSSCFTSHTREVLPSKWPAPKSTFAELFCAVKYPCKLRKRVFFSCFLYNSCTGWPLHDLDAMRVKHAMGCLDPQRRIYNKGGEPVTPSRNQASGRPWICFHQFSIWMFPKMVGFPQQPWVFLLKMIILGWRLGVPPFKETPIYVLSMILMIFFLSMLFQSHIFDILFFLVFFNVCFLFLLLFSFLETSGRSSSDDSYSVSSSTSGEIEAPRRLPYFCLCGL